MITSIEYYQKIAQHFTAESADLINQSINGNGKIRTVDYMAKHSNSLLKLAQRSTGLSTADKHFRLGFWLAQLARCDVQLPHKIYRYVKRAGSQFVPFIQIGLYSKPITQTGFRSCWVHCTTVSSSPRSCSV